MSWGKRGATVADLVRLAARRTPHRVAVKMNGGRELSYEELDARTNRLANALRARGLSPGDRLAAWMEDSIEYVEVYVAAAKAGIVIVHINARFQATEARHHLSDSGARSLVWSAGLRERVADLDTELDLSIVVGDADLDGVDEYEELLLAGADAAPSPPDPDDLYIIGYTSGTTGVPKGAMLTHRSVVAIARMNAMSYRLPTFSVVALTGSMSFVAIVPAHIITHLYVGGTIVIMGRWDSESLIATIERERVTFTYLPSPTIVEFTELAANDPSRLSSLQSVLHSASRADPEKLRGLCEVIGDRFLEGLGMTENSGGLVTATIRSDISGNPDTRDVFASVGRAAVEALVGIVDETGVPLPHDGTTVGEIVVQSPALMDGYWNQPDAGAPVLRDGWYHTGDLGTMDAAGYLYMLERRTDLIVSGGMNVYPSEVERCIDQLPGVAASAVVGVPHERWGQTVAVAIVRSDPQLSAEQVIEHCATQLASYKKPTYVQFVDELPLTASLKVKRGAVREMLVASLNDPTQ
jgi:acyl-CoA synthetase (AMP-forming)/AMP-acid ligase II